MRQVPCYLIIGDGRVAHHFQHYFSLLQLPFQTWHRKHSLSQLKAHLISSTHILLLIKDDAIETFITDYLFEYPALRIHCSGSLLSQHAFGAHPLMTFSDSLYTLKQYQDIPFVIDQDAPENLLPGLPNQQVRLAKTLKEKYHALCVLSGNFSCLLWQKFFSSLEQEFDLPAEIGQPYLMQQMQNILKNPSAALTGPLIRNDQNTLEKNLSALEHDPFQEIYRSFVTCYQKIMGVTQ